MVGNHRLQNTRNIHVAAVTRDLDDDRAVDSGGNPVNVKVAINLLLQRPVS